MTRLGRILRRFRRDERGGSVVEFTIYFPFLFAMFVASADLGIVLLRQVMLERSVDLVMRDVRLGRMTGVTHANLRAAICARTAMLPNCEEALLIEMRPVSTANWIGLANSRTCIDRAEEVEPLTTFVGGISNQLMMVRVCGRFDPFFPQTGFGLNLPSDGEGGYALTAASAFVMEPT